MSLYDYEPLIPNLELSQDELGSIFETIAATAITRGHQRELYGEIPAGNDPHIPKVFQKELKPEVVKELFYSDADDLEPKPGSHIVYGTPIKLEDEPYSPPIEHIAVKCISDLVQSPDIRYEEVFNIRRIGDRYIGEVDASYFNQDGRRISPNNVQPKSFTDMSEDDVYELVADHVIISREMMFDDADRLRMLANVVAS